VSTGSASRSTRLSRESRQSLHSMRTSLSSTASRVSRFSIASNMGMEVSVGTSMAGSHAACVDAVGNYFVWMEREEYKQLLDDNDPKVFRDWLNTLRTHWGIVYNLSAGPSTALGQKSFSSVSDVHVAKSASDPMSSQFSDDAYSAVRTPSDSLMASSASQSLNTLIRGDSLAASAANSVRNVDSMGSLASIEEEEGDEPSEPGVHRRSVMSAYPVIGTPSFLPPDSEGNSGDEQEYYVQCETVYI